MTDKEKKDVRVLFKQVLKEITDDGLRATGLCYELRTLWSVNHESCSNESYANAMDIINRAVRIKNEKMNTVFSYDPYLFPPHHLEPRIKWLEEQIESLKQ